MLSTGKKCGKNTIDKRKMGDQWMSNSTFIVLLLCSLTVSVAAVVVSVQAFWQGRRKHRHSDLRKKLGEVEVMVSALEYELDKLQSLTRRRLVAEKMKGNRNAAKKDDELTDQEWVKQTNLALTTGRK